LYGKNDFEISKNLASYRFGGNFVGLKYQLQLKLSNDAKKFSSN